MRWQVVARSVTDGLVGELRARGFRLTPQRQMIAEVVQDLTGHLSVDAIHRPVAARHPTINRSTVYRTLDLLEHLGYLTHHHEATSIIYHRTHEHDHLHLSCVTCGQTTATDLSISRGFQETLRKRHGFTADMAHSTIFGLCASCAAGGALPGAPHSHGQPELDADHV